MKVFSKKYLICLAVITLILIFAVFAWNKYEYYLKQNQSYLQQRQVQEFFEKVNNLNNSFDPAVFSLYSDDARITSVRIDRKTGKSEKISINIKDIRPIAKKLMDMAKQNNDRDCFSNVRYLIEEDRIKITADRYSHYKCYDDDSFYMIIKKDRDNSYRIIETYGTTYVQSSCKN